MDYGGLCSSILPIGKMIKSLSVISLLNSTHNMSSISTFFILFSIMYNVFNMPISYQTILNYTKMVTPYCHRFNLAHKGEVDNIQAEAYIKVRGKTILSFSLSPLKTVRSVLIISRRVEICYRLLSLCKRLPYCFSWRRDYSGNR